MGILSRFRDNKLIDMVNSTNDNSNNYRKKAIMSTPSNNGWYKCHKCGKSFRVSKMDADHVWPKSKGGSNSVNNMQLLCAFCNRSKQASLDETDRDLRRRKKELREIKKLQKDFIRKSSR